LNLCGFIRFTLENEHRLICFCVLPHDERIALARGNRRRGINGDRLFPREFLFVDRTDGRLAP
jgi:hypothetical protein